MRWAIWIGIIVIAALVFVGVRSFGEGDGETLQPPRLVREIARAFPDAIFYKETNEKVVALTIDDVPGANDLADASTQLILDTIAGYNEGLDDPAERVTATFFVIAGNLADGTAIVDRISGAGHEIGNHGDVDGTAAALPPAAFEAELRSSDARLRQFTGTPIRWYRPGRGLFNAGMAAALARMEGYEPRFALASMLPVDTFKPADNPVFSAWYLRQHIFPGAILVLHGGSAEQSRQTAEALKLILPELRSRGFRVTTFSGLWDLE
jgi:peptidoglycan/xylan/chitin deacetylase (PgdA/CDA1 family)